MAKVVSITVEPIPEVTLSEEGVELLAKLFAPIVLGKGGD